MHVVCLLGEKYFWSITMAASKIIGSEAPYVAIIIISRGDVAKLEKILFNLKQQYFSSYHRISVSNENWRAYVIK